MSLHSKHDTILHLNVGDDEGGRDVHLDPHAEEGDGGGGPVHVLRVSLVHDHAHQNTQYQSVESQQSSVSPSPAQLVGQDHAHHVAGTLHQTQEEEVEEGVARHVAHVDHHLIVDEGGGSKANSAEDSSKSKIHSREQAEVAKRDFLGGSSKLLNSDLEIRRSNNIVSLRDLGQDLGRFISLALGDQPPGGLGEEVPGEEEDGQGNHGDHLDHPP